MEESVEGDEGRTVASVPVLVLIVILSQLRAHHGMEDEERLRDDLNIEDSMGK